MAKFTIDIADELTDGIDAARRRSNLDRAEEEQFADNKAYIQFVMSSAAQSYTQRLDEIEAQIEELSSGE